jgi:hypothetical protein
MGGRAAGDYGKQNQAARMLIVVGSNSPTKNPHKYIRFDSPAMLQPLISVFFVTEMVTGLAPKMTDLTSYRQPSRSAFLNKNTETASAQHSAVHANRPGFNEKHFRMATGKAALTQSITFQFMTDWPDHESLLRLAEVIGRILNVHQSARAN